MREGIRSERRVVGRGLGGHRGQFVVQFARRIGDIAAPRLPELGDLFKQVQKAGTAVFAFRRKISTPIKRLEFRREKTIQRPAATAGGGLHEGHVNLVHVRAFFAVHLDAHEMFVEIRGHGFVLEGFSLHDVAPMAGRVADAQKNRPVFLPRPGERLFAPRVPVHRVVLVLEQVR